MKDVEKVKIVSVVGGGICVTADDGEKLYKELLSLLKINKYIELSFEDVEDVNTVFLNTSIGQLYGTEGFDESFIREHLKVIDANEQDLFILQRSVKRAKEYFKSPKRFDSATDDILGEDNE